MNRMNFENVNDKLTNELCKKFDFGHENIYY